MIVKWTRLGVYYLDGESAKGRPQYKKPKDQFAAEYLYFLVIKQNTWTF